MSSTAKRNTAGNYALGVLLAINLLNFFDRQLPGALSEPIRKEFHLNDTALGLLSTTFTLMYALVGLGIGRAVDRWQRTRLLAFGTALWSVLTAASGLAQSYLQLFVTRLGVGVGEATCAPAGQALVGDFFAPQRRARAMGIFMLGLPGGIFLSYVAAGTIGAACGWRAVFFIACLPGLVLAALAMRIAEPQRGGVERARATLSPAPSALGAYRAVLRRPTLWWIILSGVFHNFNMYAINVFQTPFLQRFHAMDLRQASTVSALSLGAVGAVGLLVGGWLADRCSLRHHAGRLLVAACSMSLTAPSIFFALSEPKGSVTGFMIWMSLGTMTMFVYYSTVYAAIQDFIPAQLRGTAVAVYFCAMYVFGASFGSTITGLLSDQFASQAMHLAGATEMAESFKAAGLHQAMYIIPVVAILAAAVLFAASATIGKDMRNIDRP